MNAGLEGAESRNADLASVNDGLTGNIASAESRIIELSNALPGTTDANAALVHDKELLNQELQASNASNRSLLEQNETLETELEHNATRYTQLVNESGTVDQLRAEANTLEEKVAALRASISELTDQRAPLIVESSTRGFSCTGSMEPKITCLDTATWLVNYAPEDIVVGTIISFEPIEECALESDSVAHRVMNIKHEDGAFYFWPQGDANDEADGCWIPEENVDSYIIDVQ